jgi:hypothetical protein
VNEQINKWLNEIPERRVVCVCWILGQRVSQS